MANLAPTRARPQATNRAAAALAALRPRQWPKNLLVLAPLVFAGQMSTSSEIVRALIGFAAFCSLSGAGYIVNDLVDVAADRDHPVKKFRPIASGSLIRNEALVLAVAAATFAVLISVPLGLDFEILLAGYGLLTCSYSLILKKLLFFDVAAVTGGFVIRAAAGAAAIGVPISAWLYLLTTLAALFLVLGKRQAEVKRSGASVGPGYQLIWLERSLQGLVFLALVAYLLYVFFAKSLPADHSMALTFPFVVYGFLRYTYLVRRFDLGGAPEEVLTADPALLIDVTLWVAVTVAVLYVLH